MPGQQWHLSPRNSFTFNKIMKYTPLSCSTIAVAAAILCSCSSDEGWGSPRVHGRHVPTLTPLPPELEPEVQRREAARAERKRQAALAQNQPSPAYQSAVSQPQPTAKVQTAAAAPVNETVTPAPVQAKPVQMIPPPEPKPIATPAVQPKKEPQASVAQTQPKTQVQTPKPQPVAAQSAPQKKAPQVTAEQTQPKPAVQAPAPKPAAQAPMPKPVARPVVQPVVKPQPRPVFTPAQKKRYPVMPGQNRGLKLRD